jgi:hypothetical protein
MIGSSTNEDESTTAVLDAVRGSLGPVAMSTPVTEIVAAGRRRRRGRAAATAGVVAAAGLAVAVTANAAPDPAGGVHVHTAAFTVDSAADGSVRIAWDKQRYFTDHEGLQAALRQAGIPVLVKVGEFCVGPRDDPSVTPSGAGPGIDGVMHGERQDGKDHAGDKPGGNRSEEAGSKADKRKVNEADNPEDGKPAGDGADAGPAEPVQLVFTPSAIPAGKQLFIGYLSPAQLAVTDGHPGSIERLVPIDGPLTCTTDLPTGG